MFDIFADGECTAVMISVSRIIYNQLSQGDWKLYLGERGDKRVYVMPSDEVGPNSFRISATNELELSLPDNAYLLT